MKRFLLIYSGPPTPPDASHEGWPEWFERLGDALVDVGSPMTNGIVLRSGAATTEDAARLNGYSIIQAADRDGAVELARDHPLAQGGEYAIELFEIPRK
jgi:YCII-related domain-containing protein